jgi:integrase
MQLSGTLKCPTGWRVSWATACKAAGIGAEFGEENDLHFHDLRGTAITRLALAGCTVPEIASVTGHSIKTVNDMLEKHYLGGRAQLAEQAIAKLDLSAKRTSARADD